MTSRDKLIERLRERVQDPLRRTDLDMSEAQYFLRTSSVETVRAARQERAERMNSIIEAYNRGELTSDRLRQETLAATAIMEADGEPLDPASASPWKLEEAQVRLGFELPEALKAIYLEVADGGFGPGCGLLPIDLIVEDYRRLKSAGSPRWPEAVLPITDAEGEPYCIRVPSGEIVRYDVVWPSEGGSEPSLLFTEVATSFDIWLKNWLDRPSAAEVAALAAKCQELFAEAKDGWRARAEAFIEKVRSSPEKRARLGLEGDDWEEKLRAGLIGD
jgi:predicted secreted protein